MSCERVLVLASVAKSTLAYRRICQLCGGHFDGNIGGTGGIVKRLYSAIRCLWPKFQSLGKAEVFVLSRSDPNLMEELSVCRVSAAKANSVHSQQSLIVLKLPPVV